MNFTRTPSSSSSSTTEACAMPTDASSKSGFTMSGNRSSDPASPPPPPPAAPSSLWGRPPPGGGGGLQTTRPFPPPPPPPAICGMGNAECGVAGRVSLADRPATAIPHSALRTPHSYFHPRHIPPNRAERDQDHQPPHGAGCRQQQHRGPQAEAVG